MFTRVLQNCKNNYLQMPCCNDRDPNPCDCGSCLREQFRDNQDKYDCHKKMNYYVLNYGPSYISEIYHYLNKSKVLEKFTDKNINILSLGCGFGPDYYAISKYIEDNHLNLNFNYYGLDNSVYWCTTRIPNINANFMLFDLTNPFSFETNQIIIMNKVFSTIRKCETTIKEIFINNLIRAINTMAPNSVLIFNEVNSYYMGRDELDNRIKNLFNNITRYYTDSPPYPNLSNPHHPKDWVNISDNHIVCQSINNGNITSLQEITQTVFFEYWK